MRGMIKVALFLMETIRAGHCSADLAADGLCLDEAGAEQLVGVELVLGVEVDHKRGVFVADGQNKRRALEV